MFFTLSKLFNEEKDMITTNSLNKLYEGEY